jgi:hypothetical protein
MILARLEVTLIANLPARGQNNAFFKSRFVNNSVFAKEICSRKLIASNIIIALPLQQMIFYMETEVTVFF